MEHAGVVTNVVPASVARDRGPPRVSRHRCLCCCASELLTSAGCRAAGSGQLTAPEVGGRRRSRLAVGARGGGGNVDRDQGRVGSQSRAQPRDQGVAAELKRVVAGGHKHKGSQKMHAGVCCCCCCVGSCCCGHSWNVQWQPVQFRVSPCGCRRASVVARQRQQQTTNVPTQRLY